MKVRIGYGIGTQGLADGGARFAELIGALEALGFDSIWCSERATGPIPEPMVSLAFAAGRTKKLKLGTSVQVLPGRNPVLLAKQWASLDVLSGGRALPAFGLGVVEPHEQQAFGVTREERAPWFLPAWTREGVPPDSVSCQLRGGPCACRGSWKVFTNRESCSRRFSHPSKSGETAALSASRAALSAASPASVISTWNCRRSWGFRVLVIRPPASRRASTRPRVWL